MELELECDLTIEVSSADPYAGVWAANLWHAKIWWEGFLIAGASYTHCSAWEAISAAAATAQSLGQNGVGVDRGAIDQDREVEMVSR